MQVRRVMWAKVGLALVSALAAFFGLLAVNQAAADTPVFINELHYDNAGTDAGEAIEIAGPAGTDLTGWSVVLYNGNGGAPYGTTTLTQTIPDQQDGFGTVFISFPSNGIQNGSPDGLALVDSGNAVIQFLSYEGSFTATAGPADGMFSTDIGVLEDGTEPVGQSLQLIGTGTIYEDFTWRTGPATSSFGAVNSDQTFGTPLPLTLAKSRQPSGDILTGGLVTYTVVLSSQSATDVASQLTDTLPAEVDFAEWVVQPLGAEVNGDEVTWTGTVTTGEAITLTFVVTNNAVDGTVTNAVTADQASQAQVSYDVNTCGNPATLISAVQSNTVTSPLSGSVVTIEGIVVGDFQYNDADTTRDLGGFYVQEESAQQDGDPSTSEGIFVYASTPDVNPGDVVRVTGRVYDYVTSDVPQTELTSVSQVRSCGTAPLPAPMDINLPVSALDDFERYEGMLVRFPQELTISEYYNFDQFGEVILALPLPGQDRPVQPTNVVTPGAEANALQLQNDLRRILLDDGRSTSDPDPAIHPNRSTFDLSNRFRGGDTVSGATGVIDQSYGVYRLQPTAAPVYTAKNLRPASPEDVGGHLKVAGFNVLNYFSTIDTGDWVCGPTGGQECRGADTPEEFTRQRTKIITALIAIDADVVGLTEIENNPEDEAVKDLVDGINTALGGGEVYTYVSTGPIGADAIKVAMLYKPASVTPVGSFQILDSSVDARFIDTRNRPVLIQTFQENATGEIFTLAQNHLKSKGSACDGDPDLGDGQGNCNETRVAAMEALVDYLETDPTGSGDPDFLIMGDLNSYAMEDPVKVAENAGYTNLIKEFQGTYAYSYLFSGQFGYLDHALASPSLASQATGAADWHINADEPDLLDYDMTYKKPAQDALYEPNAYRSSDHDPVIVGLNLAPPPQDKILYLPLVTKGQQR